ncbi:MAG: DUF4062 domain-containing protein [Bacteroidetes bacterium]|nr:DUF4062 domain-containing protein [Bacteroidota bacterium]
MRQKKRLTLMVASSVYHFEDQLAQICSILEGFGYEVWNSHLGRMPPVNPMHSNLEKCVAAVHACDIFFGIIRPFYGSGKIGDRSITHEEFRAALQRPKPRWCMVHRDVTFARQLLKPYMFKRDGNRTTFKLRRNPVLDDLRVIDLYHEAIQNDIKPAERRGHWVQEFFRIADVFTYLDSQFRDPERIRTICEEVKRP